MANKSMSFNDQSTLPVSQLEILAKWMSCNGEVWGVGPTAVFASAAALFLYHELEATIFTDGDGAQVSIMENTLVSTMVLGMLALMVHLWVCAMRLFQYYLDTLIKESPHMLLEMTTAGLLGGQAEIAALGPLTRFLKQQQPQIHITVCWFLSLCYADYVRKHYCHRFNMPYLEQWQAELHERVSRALHTAMEKLNRCVGAAHQRLRGLTQPSPQSSEANTEFTPKGDVSRCPSRTWRRCSGSASDPTLGKELCVRIIGQSSETTADAMEKLRSIINLTEWAKCGEGVLSLVPTVMWGVGTALLAHRMITALFRRFLFRRVPLWEVLLQHLLFVWMVMYSLHFWVAFVKAAKIVIEFCYEDEAIMTPEDFEGQKVMQQWAIWMFAVIPLALYIHTRPRPETPPLMIWITTSPWQRREMGPYGYYLNRPLASLQPAQSTPRHTPLRRACSDSKIILKEPPKKKRYSKSI